MASVLIARHESLSITCCEYDPKSGWMDHDERKKAMVNSFKTDREAFVEKQRPQSL